MRKEATVVDLRGHPAILEQSYPLERRAGRREKGFK
jgi:hypothetical protein